ncbi:MAG: DUF2817 domain-containing protein [Gammaproteobacteria bacterium]|nr:DUF2817 domain-containing protein [Gammaproteobacteria bacterium]
MGAPAYFRDDYFAARALFRESGARAGLAVESHRHPVPGPRGQELTTDTVLIGRARAPRLMVLISGTHGVETLCGSACQSGFLAEGRWRELGDDVAVLLVHALNCWGAAHLRRNNEDNVDLARNFLDFDAPLPENGAYEALHDALCCPQLRGPERDRADAVLAGHLQEHGIYRHISAVMGGQYRHADGFCFGGHGATWSRNLLDSLLQPFRRTAEEVCVVEYHSGLGPYGYGTAVALQTGEELERVRSIYGRWVDAPNEQAPAEDEEFFRAHGHPTEGLRDLFSGSGLASIVLEFGTYPPMESLPVLFEDHWLAHHGDAESVEGRRIKQRLLEMHHPADPDWRQAVWDRSVQVIEQTLRALAGPGSG